MYTAVPGRVVCIMAMLFPPDVDLRVIWADAKRQISTCPDPEACLNRETARRDFSCRNSFQEERTKMHQI